jgi:hypothetical protein
LVEQRFCKPPVIGSNPIVGSLFRGAGKRLLPNASQR